MIPKAHRLVISSRNPFIGQKSSYPLFTLITKDKSLGTISQWAIRVSKKIDNRATVRNRLRRQLNNWLYQHRAELKPQQFLIILRRKPEESGLPKIYEEIKQKMLI